jgi:hypothetical protein
VPKPATGITAFLILLVIFIPNYSIFFIVLVVKLFVMTL